ncbi:uncharacterized protein E0L32_000078 [Thyridium curvatum]|uniref:Uncharacterized protein n=1 Tax=Thyridium curvatum TaxID=1093900 RepID=A0A507BAW3_9PEZI|nr:uncharacterized protein E0L32_000078 [Thyridium curvatum]TPX15744.1 hypothetical protein E0L32_000078 [Thyridium curvatum]
MSTKDSSQIWHQFAAAAGLPVDGQHSRASRGRAKLFPRESFPSYHMAVNNYPVRRSRTDEHHRQSDGSSETDNKSMHEGFQKENVVPAIDTSHHQTVDPARVQGTVSKKFVPGRLTRLRNLTWSDGCREHTRMAFDLEPVFADSRHKDGFWVEIRNASTHFSSSPEPSVIEIDDVQDETGLESDVQSRQHGHSRQPSRESASSQSEKTPRFVSQTQREPLAEIYARSSPDQYQETSRAIQPTPLIDNKELMPGTASQASDEYSNEAGKAGRPHNISVQDPAIVECRHSDNHVEKSPHKDHHIQPLTSTERGRFEEIVNRLRNAKKMDKQGLSSTCGRLNPRASEFCFHQTGPATIAGTVLEKPSRLPLAMDLFQQPTTQEYSQYNATAETGPGIMPSLLDNPCRIDLSTQPSFPTNSNALPVLQNDIQAGPFPGATQSSYVLAPPLQALPYAAPQPVTYGLLTPTPGSLPPILSTPYLPQTHVPQLVPLPPVQPVALAQPALPMMGLTNPVANSIGAGPGPRPPPRPKQPDTAGQINWERWHEEFKAANPEYARKCRQRQQRRYEKGACPGLVRNNPAAKSTQLQTTQEGPVSTNDPSQPGFERNTAEVSNTETVANVTAREPANLPGSGDPVTSDRNASSTEGGIPRSSAAASTLASSNRSTSISQQEPAPRATLETQAGAGVAKAESHGAPDYEKHEA